MDAYCGYRPFGARVSPGILLLRSEAPETFKSIESVSSFRYLLALSVIPLQRARAIVHDGHAHLVCNTLRRSHCTRSAHSAVSCSSVNRIQSRSFLEALSTAGPRRSRASQECLSGSGFTCSNVKSRTGPSRLLTTVDFTPGHACEPKHSK